MLFIPNESIRIERQTSHALVGFKKSCTPSTGWLVNGKIIASFAGYEAALDYVNKYMPKAQQEGASSKPKNSNFYSLKDYDTCMDTFRNHPERIRTFTENDTRLEGGDASGLDIQYDVTGDFIDIDRYLSGEPEHYGQMDNGIPRGQRITIMFTNSWVNYISQFTIIARNKRIIRLIDWLESQGVRVQAIAVASAPEYHIETMAKHYDEALDLNAIAILSHTDWSRRIQFRIAEYTPNLAGGYGNHVVFPDSLRTYTSINSFTRVLHDSSTIDANDNLILISQYGEPDKHFDNLEKQLTTVLSDPQAEPQLFKVMVEQ